MPTNHVIVKLDDLRAMVREEVGAAQDTARLNWMETHAGGWSQKRRALTFWHLQRKYTVHLDQPLAQGDPRSAMRVAIDQLMREYP